jgi:site-specific recombinase XerD
MLDWWRRWWRLDLGFGSQGGFPVTHLRQLMLDELERRNYSPNTVRSYLHAVEEFARHFGRSPEQLGPDHVREYQVHLFRDRKLSARTIAGQTAALRFLFVKTLRRPYLPDALPFPKHSRRLPTVLSQEEVARLIDASGNLMHRAMLMTLYATGVRRAELCRLRRRTACFLAGRNPSVRRRPQVRHQEGQRQRLTWEALCGLSPSCRRERIG